MTTPFLTYELLTPETADPVVIRIREQGERFMRREYLSSNGILITTAFGPGYFPGPTKHPELFLRGDDKSRDLLEIEIPLSDWPAVKQAIRELNEHYSPVAKAMGDKKEKDMKHEKDEYEFPIDEWDWTVCAGDGSHLVLTRKKPKVEDRENTPVKMEALKAKYDKLVEESSYRDDNAISRNHLFSLLSGIIFALEDRANGGKG